MWAQYDFGDGPRVAGVKTILLCAWLAWSRTRVIIPILDKTLPSVFAALDACFRLFGGAPTFLLTDNEKTVSIDHVAGIPVRNPGMVAFARHYGVTVHTCMPADPASKGGTEATVKLAKADLVPTEANLRDEYASFTELEAACAAFTEQVNTRSTGSPGGSRPTCSPRSTTGCTRLGIHTVRPKRSVCSPQRAVRKMARSSGSAMAGPTSMLIWLRRPRSGQRRRAVHVRREPETVAVWRDQV